MVSHSLSFGFIPLPELHGRVTRGTVLPAYALLSGGQKLIGGLVLYAAVLFLYCIILINPNR